MYSEYSKLVHSFEIFYNPRTLKLEIANNLYSTKYPKRTYIEFNSSIRNHTQIALFRPITRLNISAITKPMFGAKWKENSPISVSSIKASQVIG